MRVSVIVCWVARTWRASHFSRPGMLSPKTVAVLTERPWRGYLQSMGLRLPLRNSRIVWWAPAFIYSTLDSSPRCAGYDRWECCSGSGQGQFGQSMEVDRSKGRPTNDGILIL